MSAPTFTYVPAPHERAYYGALFQAADTERTGSIGGGRAVEFFTRSKVPIAVLKQIWTASDQPPSNSLDPRKFAVAVRLIQLEQNGVKPSAGDLAQAGGPNLRPAFFEGIPPPPSSPQQGGVPLPPQGPPPQQQQHYEVPTPPRPPNASSSSMGGSVASASVGGPPPQQHMPMQQQQLTVQDPYTLTPQEQARYEQIFPEYCKQDPNFMYGAEAVALFGKSGLEQAKLAQIWNMVDHPVDNRLDKLEFAMAMHLIVCVSKKNLPLPPALPLSLKQLKSQKPPPPGMPPQQQQNGGPPPIQRVGTSDGSMGGGGAGGGSFSMAPPSPRGMMQQAPVSPQQQQMASSPASPGGIPSPGRGPPPLPSGFGAGGGRGPPSSGMMGGGSSSNLSGLPGPPPITQQAGGLSISDAFEGLAAGNGDTGSISSYRATTPVVTQKTPSYVHSSHDDEPSKPPEPVSEASEPAPAPKTSIQLASSYDMGDTHEELVKLRAILQKLQAENISLKARMEGMTEEEKDIQRELSATVSEVSKLSSELTTLRAQVLASKSRLLEASAELKAAKEKKGVISDLISEARATKTAIDEAYDGVETANEAAHAAPPAPAPAETDFFGGWGSDAPPPAPLPAATENAPLRARTENVETSQPQHDETPSYDHTPAPAAPGMFDGGGYDPGHNRNISNMSGFGEVMGTGPGLGSLSAVEETSLYGSSSVPGSPSMAEVEVMKSKSKEADDVAKDAEESRRQLTAQLEEMRRLADEAENLSRAASAKPVKKKGLLRRGGVQEKKDAKELERLAMDARDKKEKLMQVQAQVKDAEALAAATKKEAEKLNKEAEDAQMQAASMASMQQQPKPTPPPPSMQEQKQPPPPQAGLNGYPPQSSAMPMSYGMGQGGFGGQPSGDGFDANVMGSGGSSIPTPANGGGDDPYSNPFE